MKESHERFFVRRLREELGKGRALSASPQARRHPLTGVAVYAPAALAHGGHTELKLALAMARLIDRGELGYDLARRVRGVARWRIGEG